MNIPAPTGVIAEVFNLEGRKVIVFADLPPEICLRVSDRIRVHSADGNTAIALIAGIELINYRDPKSYVPGSGGLMIRWIDNPIEDFQLRGSTFTKVDL